MGGHRSRLSLAVGLTALAAGAATVLLRPRGDLLEGPAVDPKAYFSAAQIDRAADYGDLQRLIGIGGLAVSALTLVVFVVRPPRRLLDRLAARPLIGGAAVGAGLSVALTVTGLPLSIWAHERSVDFGLATQSIVPYLADTAKSGAVSAVFAAVGGLVAIALLRRFPRRWWIPGAGAVAVFSVLLIYLQPIVLDPLFNRFEPLPRGPLRSDVLRLADRAGVDVGQVYRVDASRRTTASNAYVNGLGHTKRVVIYDNLIRDYPERQARSVVAHELGHVKHHDVPRGLLWVLIVVLPGTLLAQRLAESFDRTGQLRSGRRIGPAALPAVGLSVALISFALTCAGNTLSRPVEASADTFALTLTDDPRAFIDLQRHLAISNLGSPKPPALTQALFGTHPTPVQRIGAGKAWEEGRRP